MVDCTIVVPVWCFDRRISQVWKDAEAAYRANSDGARLYVVDNGSAVPIRADHRFEQNQGWAGAVNHGLAAADTEWIAVGSHDTIVPPGWLRPLLRSGIASPIEAGITEKKKKSRGSFFGSLFVMHRDVYDTIGGIDPDFPVIGDQDFACRAASAGFPVVQYPIEVEHREPSRARKRGRSEIEKDDRARFKEKWGAKGFGAWQRTLGYGADSWTS